MGCPKGSKEKTRGMPHGVNCPTCRTAWGTAGYTMGVLIGFIIGVLFNGSYHGSYGDANRRTPHGTTVKSVGCTTRDTPLTRRERPHGAHHGILQGMHMRVSIPLVAS